MSFLRRASSMESLSQKSAGSDTSRNGFVSRLVPALSRVRLTDGSGGSLRNVDFSERALPCLPAVPALPVVPALPSLPALSAVPVSTAPAPNLTQSLTRPLTPVTEEAKSLSSTDSMLAADSMLDTGRSLYESTAPTYQTQATEQLPALQVHGADADGLEPLAEEEIDPGSFDLVVPANATGPRFSTLEERSRLLFSREHLHIIMDDATLLHHFATFLCTQRPGSVPLLTYYLEALKALRAIEYANEVARGLESLQSYAFTNVAPTELTANLALREKAEAVLMLLAREDLPAYITHTWIQTVTTSINRRVAGSLPAILRDMSEGLAEVFCLTDPSRHDNPIVFASEEFHKTTQYGVSYVIGRNCRFLQGPATEQSSVRRIREALAAGEEHYETFLNYRRDGTPFMNLIMLAPLIDSRGTVRYHLGAQVDVSGLVKQAYGLDSFRRLIESKENKENKESKERTHAHGDEAGDDTFTSMCELFNTRELELVRRRGGHMHRPAEIPAQDRAESSSNWQQARMVIQDGDTINELSRPSTAHSDARSFLNQPDHSSIKGTSLKGTSPKMHGRLTGVYEHYLLVRPAPSLRVLFCSPTLRVPGMLQSRFLDRIGGSERVRDELSRALEEGRKVTAKVRWVALNARIKAAHLAMDDETKAREMGRPRWIHCTPLLGANGAVGVWMVIVVDDEETPYPDGQAVNGNTHTHTHTNTYTQGRTPSVSGAAGNRRLFRSDSSGQRSAAAYDYHSVTRQLHQPGSSAALRTPANTGRRARGGDASGFGLSGLDMHPVREVVANTSASADDKARWRHGSVAADAGYEPKTMRMRAYEPDEDGSSVKSMASSNLTVKIGDS